MAEDDTPDPDAATAKGGKKRLMRGVAIVAIALVAAGGGFYATYSGKVASLLAGAPESTHSEAPVSHAFLELDPILVSIGGPGSLRTLRFRAHLQVLPEAASATAALSPRIQDIFTTYLRAVSVETLEDPTALLRVRAQLLRRVQLLAGPDAVEDLLISEFVVT